VWAAAHRPKDTSRLRNPAALRKIVAAEVESANFG
jgi:hypothetical protein